MGNVGGNEGGGRLPRSGGTGGGEGEGPRGGERREWRRPPGTREPNRATYKAVLNNNPDARRTVGQLSRKLHQLKEDVDSGSTDPTWVDPVTGAVYDGRRHIPDDERYIGNLLE